MKKSLEEKETQARETLKSLLRDYKTVSLATVDAKGNPQVSYTPAAVDKSRNFYLFVSELSEHTGNLQSSGQASLMLIEDESKSTQLFARNRLTLNGDVTEVGRETEEWSQASDVYRERFGKFFDQLSTLRDFHMFCFRPKTARLVVGFGAAFEVGLPDWTDLTLLTGK